MLSIRNKNGIFISNEPKNHLKLVEFLPHDVDHWEINYQSIPSHFFLDLKNLKADLRTVCIRRILESLEIVEKKTNGSSLREDKIRLSVNQESDLIDLLSDGHSVKICSAMDLNLTDVTRSLAQYFFGRLSS